MAKRAIMSLIILAITGASGVMADTGEDAVQVGNDAFALGKLDEALAQYQVGETESPESPQLDYNIANLMYEMGKYEEALDRFNGALEGQDADLYAATHYNMGNTYYRMGDYQQAIASYTKALEANPDDMDAKLNLELARKMLKDNMQPDENEDQEQDKQEQEQQEQEQQEQQQSDEQKDQDQQQSDQQSESEPKEEQDQGQQAQEPKEISKEDAERILNALKDDERDVQKKIKRQVMGGDYIGNDW
jgi:tetratricopeptide (TPR) repeat protein